MLEEAGTVHRHTVGFRSLGQDLFDLAYSRQAASSGRSSSVAGPERIALFEARRLLWENKWV
jgi:hypothetical protein